jgi:nitrous oxidase accessory protein NosD
MGAVSTRLVIAIAIALAVAVASCADAGIRVTSTADEGPGTLRAAIERANAEPGSTILLALDAGQEIRLARQLPVLAAEGTVLDGRGGTLRQADGCVRPDGRDGCDGIVVGGPGIVVRDLRVAGFTFDGVAARGKAATDVRIAGVHAVDNLDDGIGVSDGAGPVLVEDCVLMGNGFRTKGKGLLVFDGSSVTMRNSTVVANRDGVTVTKGAKLLVEDSWIVGNWDKGLGVSGANVKGRKVRLLANGRGQGTEAAPNSDGLRVGLAGSAELADCLIAGNGDAGVVVLDTSTVTLERCTVADNRGRDVSVADGARLIRRR